MPHVFRLVGMLQLTAGGLVQRIYDISGVLDDRGGPDDARGQGFRRFVPSAAFPPICMLQLSDGVLVHHVHHIPGGILDGPATRGWPGAQGVAERPATTYEFHMVNAFPAQAGVARRQPPVDLSGAARTRCTRYTHIAIPSGNPPAIGVACRVHRVHADRVDVCWVEVLAFADGRPGDPPGTDVDPTPCQVRKLSTSYRQTIRFVCVVWITERRFVIHFFFNF